MGSRARTWRVHFHHAVEEAAAVASKVAPRVIEGRQIKVDGRYYRAFDAEDALRLESLASQARPGHPHD